VFIYTSFLLRLRKLCFRPFCRYVSRENESAIQTYDPWEIYCHLRKICFRPFCRNVSRENESAIQTYEKFIAAYVNRLYESCRFNVRRAFAPRETLRYINSHNTRIK